MRGLTALVVALALLDIGMAGQGAPAWGGQLNPIAPPPLIPMPALPPPTGEQPIEPGVGQPPFLTPAPQAPPVLTSPTPPAFEFIVRDPARYDPTLLIHPLDVPRRYFLSVVLREEYDSNIGLAPDGQQEYDLSTSLTLAGSYRMQTARTFIVTSNSITARYSPRFSNRTRLSFANLGILAGHEVTPRFTVGASESFVLTDDLLQVDEDAGAQSGRSRALRNNFSPQATYALTQRTAVTARYANTIVMQLGDTADQGTGDSMTHRFNGDLSHRFSERTGGSLGYSYVIRSNGTDFNEHNATAGLTHAVNPITSLSLNGSASFRDQRTTATGTGGGTDRKIYALSVGATRAFTPTFSGSASVGGQRIERNGSSNLNPTFNAALSKEGLRYRIAASASYATQDTSGQVTDVGDVLRQQASIEYSYFPSFYWLFTLRASYARSNFAQAERAGLIGIQQNTIDKSYRFGASANYRLARSISLRLSYDLFMRDSSQTNRDSVDNRVALSISATISE